MGRARDLLHFKHLDAFGQFLETQGYMVIPPITNAYEVLRAVPIEKRKGQQPVVVYARVRASEHATVYGDGLKLAIEFYRQRRRTAE